MQQFGVIGLSVMGKNLALNVRNHGFSVSGFSIDKPEVDALAKYEDDKLKPCYTWEEFVNSLEKPRKILVFRSPRQRREGHYIHKRNNSSFSFPPKSYLSVGSC